MESQSGGNGKTVIAGEPFTEQLVGPSSLAWGRGSIIVDGGTISVLILLGIAVGASVAIEGFAILDLVFAAVDEQAQERILDKVICIVRIATATSK